MSDITACGVYMISALSSGQTVRLSVRACDSPACLHQV